MQIIWGQDKEASVMKRRTIMNYALALAVAGVLVSPSDVLAQAMVEYTASPPFVTETVPPNILLLLDNSGSMNRMAYETAAEAFDPTKTYTGLFTAGECYEYQTNKFVPNPATDPTTMPGPGWVCAGGGNYKWSGNLLNYASMRRIDIAKWVLVGGMCAVTRGADLSCASAKAQDLPFKACCKDQTQVIPKNKANGRMPVTLTTGPGNLYFHLMGSKTALRGKFCVDNDSEKPEDANCNNWSAASEEYVIRADQVTNSTGACWRWEL